MIKFWKTREKFGCFSNFSKHSIIVNGKIYATTEHYYQAMKFLDVEKQEKVRLCKTAREAKDTARETSPLREDWEEIKYNVMKDALRFKVEQHPEIKIELISTGTQPLAEDSPYDYEWGLGKDNSGKNLLGKAWMDIREEIRSDPVNSVIE